MSTRKTLKALVEARRGVIVPGAFNALSARVIADLGFEALYVTGAGVTNMWFGMPDQGFMGLAEIADHTARIRDAVEVPLIVDADTGFGNAVNVHHTVRTLERDPFEGPVTVTVDGVTRVVGHKVAACIMVEPIRAE